MMVGNPPSGSEPAEHRGGSLVPRRRVLETGDPASGAPGRAQPPGLVWLRVPVLAQRCGLSLRGGHLLKLGGLALLCLWPALAQAEGLFALEQGSGGASRAHLASLSTPLTAPGVLALAPRYDVGVGAGIGAEKVRLLNAAAIDSTTGPVALGVLAEFHRATSTAGGDSLPGWKEPDEELENIEQGMTIAGGLAGSWFNRGLGLGFGGVYRSEGGKYEAQSSDFNASASVAAQFSYQLCLSLTAENLIPTDFVHAPMRMALGTRWQPDPNAGLAVDLVAPLEGDFALIYQLSADFAVGGKVPLRVGFERDGVEQTDKISAGLSVGELPAILDYGFQMEVGQGDENTSGWKSWHALTLRLRF